MPTAIGCLFIGVSLFCLAKRQDWLFGLVILSSIFQASSAINIGSQGIQPYFVVACIFIASEMLSGRFWKGDWTFKGKGLAIVLGLYGALSAILFPVIFAGIPVYSPKVGIDDGYFYRPPLHLGLGNFAQVAFLIIDLLVLCAAASTPKTEMPFKFYYRTFWLLSTLVIIQFIFLQLGITFPYSILQNNPGYAITDISGMDSSARVMGTFSEPSGAGLALVLFFSGFFQLFYVRQGTAFKMIAALISIGLVRSSSALVAAAAVMLCVMLVSPIFRSLLVIRVARMKKFAIVLAGMALVVLSPLSGSLREYTLDKGDTLSYLHRTAADLFSLQLLVSTKWMGVGLGSNRPSSLIVSLLSNIGIPGTILYFSFLVQVSRNAVGEQAWIRWSLFGGTLAMCLGDPDITSPFLWAVAAMACYSGSLGQRNDGIPAFSAASSKSPQVA